MCLLLTSRVAAAARPHFESGSPAAGTLTLVFGRNLTGLGEDLQPLHLLLDCPPVGDNIVKEQEGASPLNTQKMSGTLHRPKRNDAELPQYVTAGEGFFSPCPVQS